MKEEFLKKLQDAIGCETPLQMQTDLLQLPDWDSFSAVAFIALANCDYGKRPEKKDVIMAKTVADLYKLVQ